MPSESLGYSFPNDLHILWSLMIVMYPYVTGLVAGAFIVSSLYHVFGRAELRPVGRLSMVASLAFLFVAPLPLLLHLGHPERCFNILITPHFTSAMAAFGLIYALYLTLLIVEIWLVYRRDIILVAARSTGLKRTVFLLLALGVRRHFGRGAAHRSAHHRHARVAGYSGCLYSSRVCRFHVRIGEGELLVVHSDAHNLPVLRGDIGHRQ